MESMTVRFVAGGGVVEKSVADVAVLLGRGDGFVWLDVPVWTSEIDGLLAGVLGLHPVAREYCRVRNHMPMVHGYQDHVFMVLHRPVVLLPSAAEPTAVLPTAVVLLPSAPDPTAVFPSALLERSAP